MRLCSLLPTSTAVAVFPGVYTVCITRAHRRGGVDQQPRNRIWNAKTVTVESELV